MFNTLSLSTHFFFHCARTNKFQLGENSLTSALQLPYETCKNY